MPWSIGQSIWIICSAEPGAFSDERLVIIESKQGAVSGFVKESELKASNGTTMVRGVVRGVASDALEAWIDGSFFTTSGLTHVSPEIAVAA